jgi:ParB-like chromosome segregation protein Spo0J
MKTRPDAGEVLVISSQPYAHYQDASVKSALPPEFHVETVAAQAPDDIKISVALDNFARQIDVNLAKTIEKLKSTSQVISTPIIGIAPESIKVDAATYQFRAGGDANGVTEKGRYQADHWDPILHGDPIMVHERLDGTMYVADGHHRVELAKELNAKGVGPGNIMAMVLSEKQGYTAKDAKIIAAYKNIAHGSTDVIEVAKVFKEANSGEVHTELLPNLQMDKGNLRMAFTLSKLSDKVLDQVASEKIDPKIAEKLAEAVPDDAAKQEAVMEIISNKLKQNYPPMNESRATSVNVNMSSLNKPEPTPAVPGFVAKLSMERSKMQTSTQVTTRT